MAPSVATRNGLVAALYYRAHRKLQADPDYAALAKKCERTLGTSLINYALAEGTKGLRDLVVANPDVVRAARLTLEDFELEPDRASSRAWVLVRVLGDAQAQKVAKAVQQDRIGNRTRVINRLLSPPSVSRVLDDCWTLRLAGKDEEAAQVLARAARDGVPLP